MCGPSGALRGRVAAAACRGRWATLVRASRHVQHASRMRTSRNIRRLSPGHGPNRRMTNARPRVKSHFWARRLSGGWVAEVVDDRGERETQRGAEHHVGGDRGDHPADEHDQRGAARLPAGFMRRRACVSAKPRVLSRAHSTAASGETCPGSLTRAAGGPIRAVVRRNGGRPVGRGSMRTRPMTTIATAARPIEPNLTETGSQLRLNARIQAHRYTHAARYAGRRNSESSIRGPRVSPRRA